MSGYSWRKAPSAPKGINHHLLAERRGEKRGGADRCRRRLDGYREVLGVAEGCKEDREG